MRFDWKRALLLAATLFWCAGLPYAAQAGVIEVRIASGDDDSEEKLTDFDGAANRIDRTSSDLELGGEDSGQDLQLIGMRFLDLAIPNGASIDTSFIQFTVDETDDEPTSLRIYGELIGNSPGFTTDPMDLSNRSLTTAFVNWNNIPNWDTVGVAGPDQATPNLGPIIQEIVGLPAWSPGNALSIIIEPNPGGERTAESFSGSSATAPLLSVSGPSIVTPPPPPPPPPLIGFQQGTDGYTGTADTEIRGNDPTADRSAATELNPDGSDGGSEVHVLLRFDEIFGGGVGQIPTSGAILSGTLTLEVTNPGNALDVHRMLRPWNDTDTWNTFGPNGIEANGVVATAAPFFTTPNVVTGPLVIDVTESLNAWQADPSSNYGWVFLPTGNDGVDFFSAEGGTPPILEFVASGSFELKGNGMTIEENFDGMGVGSFIPSGWSGVTNEGTQRSTIGLGLTDGFLTVPGNDGDGILGVLNLGGNAERFGPAPDGFVPTWTAELGGADPNLYDQGDVVADNATDRALGVSRVNNDDVGELNFEIQIAEGNLRAFVVDWDLEIWGGDPDGVFRAPEGPGMKVDLKVGGTTYYEESQNLLPGAKFDSTEDGSGSTHNATLIDGNVHSIRGMTSGIREVSGDDGAVGNFVQVNFNSNWNDATDGDANGWIVGIDNFKFRALAPGDADANGVVDVADLLALLGGQKFNQGVQGVTWEQGDFNADDQFNTGDLLAMLSFLSGTFPSDPYASEAGGANDAVADIIVNSETGEVTVDLAGHTVSAIIIESASEIFNGSEPEWDTTSQFPSTLPGELGNVLFTSTASGVDELGAVISAEFLGRDKEFYLQDLDLNILIASEGGALTKGNVIVVPEPSTLLLAAFGMMGAVACIYRRKRFNG